MISRSGSAVLVAGVLAMCASSQALSAQSRKPAIIELTGCVSLSPVSSGQFGFVDGASGGTYRLNGKGVSKYAGQRVTVVGDPSRKRVRVRLGLWPSPNIAAQAGAIDPAQESIARQPGGIASGAESRLPELRVVRMRSVSGACG
jgi:hypothetical protein